MKQPSSNSSCQFLFKLSITFHCYDTYFSVKFKLIHFLLWTKESYQSPNFDTFNCSGENLPNFSCHFSNHKSAFPKILHHSSVSLKITPLYSFSSNITYLVTRSPLKHKSYRFYSARVKIFRILHVNFKTTSHFLFNFCIIIYCHDT